VLKTGNKRIKTEKAQTYTVNEFEINSLKSGTHENKITLFEDFAKIFQAPDEMLDVRLQ
jgi:hypothetical protein